MKFISNVMRVKFRNSNRKKENIEHVDIMYLFKILRGSGGIKGGGIRWESGIGDIVWIEMDRTRGPC
jgi:hypothetical protein